MTLPGDGFWWLVILYFHVSPKLLWAWGGVNRSSLWCALVNTFAFDASLMHCESFANQWLLYILCGCLMCAYCECFWLQFWKVAPCSAVEVATHYRKGKKKTPWQCTSCYDFCYCCVSSWTALHSCMDLIAMLLLQKVTCSLNCINSFVFYRESKTSVLITDKLPSEEYHPSQDDLKKAESCLNGASLHENKLPEQANNYKRNIILHFLTCIYGKTSIPKQWNMQSWQKSFLCVAQTLTFTVKELKTTQTIERKTAGRWGI